MQHENMRNEKWKHGTWKMETWNWEHEKWKHDNGNMKHHSSYSPHSRRSKALLKNCSKPAFYISKALLENCSKPAFYINDSARKLSFTSTVPVFYIDDSARKLSFTSTALLKTSARKPLQPDFSSNLFIAENSAIKNWKLLENILFELILALKATFRA